MSPALLALSVCTFALGFAEFVAVSLVPAIAADTGLSVGDVGLMIGLYAIGVSIGAPSLSVLLARAPRRGVLAACMLLFALANAITAMFGDMPVLLASRFVAGLMHGVVLALASSTAAAAVGAARSGRAIATVFGGLTVALMLGVPMGTLAGGWLPWQDVFWGIGLIAAAGGLALMAFTPVVAPGVAAASSSWWATAADGLTRTTLLTTALAYAGSFTGFTYISVLLTQRTGLSASGVAAMFVLYGVSAALGNALGGRLVDHVGGRRSALCVIAGIALSLGGAMWGAGSAPLMALVMALWGLASFGAVPVLQKTVLVAAEHNPRGSPELASGLNIAAFNVGIALGSLLGGIASRHSPEAPMLAGLVPLCFTAWCASRLNAPASPSMRADSPQDILTQQGR